MIKFLVLILFSSTFYAKAQNTGGVFGPGVNENHKSFQYRLALDPDNAQGNTAFAQRAHYQQAIDGDFMWRVIGQTRKTQDSDFDFDYIQGELFWQLQQSDSYLGGVRFDLRARDNNRPNQFGFNWMNEFIFNNQWRARFLVLTSVQFGSNAADGVSLQTRESIWKKHSFGNLGLEIYNAYGSTERIPSVSKQTHTIGPFYSKPIGKSGWTFYTGVQFGITDASPDTDFRLWLTKKL